MLMDLTFSSSLLVRQLTNAPDLTRASRDRLLKPIGAKSIFRLFFSVIAEKIRTHLSFEVGIVLLQWHLCRLVSA